MKINVRAVCSSSKQRVKKEHGVYKVYVCASPEKGKANKEVVEVLSRFFNIKRTKVEILKGFTSREKVIHIDDSES